MDESTTLSDALIVVRQAKDKIGEVDALLPSSAKGKKSFRERLVDHIEDANPQFRVMARELLIFYRDHFGVKNIVDDLEEG